MIRGQSKRFCGFMRAMGQTINLKKIFVYVSKNVMVDQTERLRRILKVKPFDSMC